MKKLICSIALLSSLSSFAKEEAISVRNIPVSPFGELVNVIYHDDQLFFLSQPYSSTTNQLFKIDLKTGFQTNSQYFQSMSNTCNAGTILDFDSANSQLMVGTRLFSNQYDTVFDLNFTQINTVKPKRTNHEPFVDNTNSSAALASGPEKDLAVAIAGFEDNDHWPYWFQIRPTVYQISISEYFVLFMKNSPTCRNDGNVCGRAVLVAAVVDLAQQRVISQTTQDYLYGEKAIPNTIPVFSAQNAIGNLFRFSLIPLSPECEGAGYHVLKL